MRHIGHGYYAVSGREALRLTGDRLPAPGRERLVELDGKHWWLSQIIDNGQPVWAIRDAHMWRLVNGIAVL